MALLHVFGMTLAEHYINGTRIYLLAWTFISIIASAGAIHDYEHGPTATLWFAAISTYISGSMILAFSMELYFVRNNSKPHDKPTGFASIRTFLQYMHDHNVPNHLMHIAIQLLSICSVGLAAIYMHDEKFNWTFGFSCALFIMVLLYNVLYLPTNILDVALFTTMSPEQQVTIQLQYKATPFLWKARYVDDLLEPSTI